MTESVQTCSVGPCEYARVPGTLYCTQHGPRAGASVEASAPSSTALVCPHCQVRGQVSSRRVKQKKGVSGGKLTGAILTAGISMLGTGLSRKEKVTEMRCGNCKTVWHV